MTHQGERSTLYPGIPEALEALTDRHSLFVLSNKPHAATVREVEVHSIRSLFEAVWGAGSFNALKPDPAGVNAARQYAGASHQQTVMVGDLFVDIQTGINAAVATVFVEWGFGQLGDIPKPSRIISSSEALVDAVDQLITPKKR